MQQFWMAIFLAGALLLSACQPEAIVLEVTRLVEPERVVEVTRVVSETARSPETSVAETSTIVPMEVIVEVTKAPLGTAARPVQLLFPPVADPDTLNQRGLLLAEALREATGYEFAVGILDSEQAVIEMMCAAPVETVGFLSPAGYVAARVACDVEPGTVGASPDGLASQTGMIVALRESNFDDVVDLEGQSWGITGQESLADHLYFEALLAEAGVTPGEIVRYPTDSAALLALNEGEVAFVTVDFTPPIMPFEERLWEYGVDDPEPFRFLGIPPTRSPIGYIVVNGDPENGGYRLRDARSRVFDVAPQIFDRTEIIALGAQIPNDGVAFGRDFPLGLARQMVGILGDFASSEQCVESICSSDFYGWTGLQAAEDALFQPVRFVQETLALSAAELLELVQATENQRSG